MKGCVGPAAAAGSAASEDATDASDVASVSLTTSHQMCVCKDGWTDERKESLALVTELLSFFPSSQEREVDTLLSLSSRSGVTGECGHTDVCVCDLRACLLPCLASERVRGREGESEGLQGRARCALFLL